MMGGSTRTPPMGGTASHPRLCVPQYDGSAFRYGWRCGRYSLVTRHRADHRPSTLKRLPRISDLEFSPGCHGPWISELHPLTALIPAGCPVMSHLSSPETIQAYDWQDSCVSLLPDLRGSGKRPRSADLAAGRKWRQSAPDHAGRNGRASRQG